MPLLDAVGLLDSQCWSWLSVSGIGVSSDASPILGSLSFTKEKRDSVVNCVEGGLEVVQGRLLGTSASC